MLVGGPPSDPVGGRCETHDPLVLRAAALKLAEQQNGLWRLSEPSGKLGQSGQHPSVRSRDGGLVDHHLLKKTFDDVRRQ